MSTGVCGIVHTDMHDVSLEIDLSFYFEKKANEYGIGTKMGGNISKYVYDKYAEERGKGGVIFELTDSPIDIHAEYLFSPDDYESRADLKDRMKRVQNLIENLLKHEHVTQIILEINYLFGESQDKIAIKVSDFCERIIRIFQNQEAFLPMLKFEITLR